MSIPDQELIEGCRQGRADSWEALLKQYERLVFSIALNYGLSHDDAADVCQYTFTTLLQSLEKLQEESRLAPWLATVARRRTWRLLERQRRESSSSFEETDGYISGVHSDFGQVARWERVAWLEQGLAALDQRCRALLLALYFDSRQPSYEEVAGQLDMAVGSIGPTRARCLKKLKEIMEEEAHSPGKDPPN